jgi:2-oxoglutarate/2-oxoacid ferredoxin oxidoreductase subunit beta
MIKLSESISASEWKSDVKPVWCPGCGNYGVMNAVVKALVELRQDPSYLVVTSGIGCSGRFPAYLNSYGFHGIHGRALPLATGVKTANPELTVVAVSGDGDALSIGAGHLPHTARRNVDITYLVLDNSIYGMTKGQPSPTSPCGMRRKASPYGSIDTPVNPIAMLLSYETSFVARGLASKVADLASIVRRAIEHPGFAFVHIMSPCVTFNNTYSELKEAAVPIPEDHDRQDRLAAMRLAWEPELYTGIFFEAQQSTHSERVADLYEGVGHDFGIEEVIERFRR